MTVAYIEVVGTPIPQGSKRAFRAGNRIVMTDVQGQALGLWRENVARCARKQVLAPNRGTIAMTMLFRFPRPLGHFGKKGLRPSAPTAKITKPDLDKLVRAVLDALTGVAYFDDSQVTHIVASKAYCDPERSLPGMTLAVYWDE